MEDWFEVLKRKLALVKKLDPGLVFSGARTHKYSLRPCLSEGEVIEFEDRFGFTLPGEYRGFLLHMGNGGAGPANGVYSLDEVAREIDLKRDSPQDPFVPPATVQESYDLPYLAPGTIPLSHMGSGNMFMLVVTGGERGNVWTWTQGGVYLPLEPQEDREPMQFINDPQEAKRVWTEEAESILAPDYKGRVGFLTWYEDWLDHVIERMQSGQYRPKRRRGRLDRRGGGG